MMGSLEGQDIKVYGHTSVPAVSLYNRLPGKAFLSFHALTRKRYLTLTAELINGH